MIRPLEEQFERPTVRRIRTLVSAFAEVDLPGGPVRYMACEVRRCLEAGLLLAAVQVSAALFERFIRKLLILSKVGSLRRSNESLSDLLDRTEDEVEADRQLDVPRLLDELEKKQLIQPMDAASARDFYSNVALPLQHALTGRYIRAQHRDDKKTVQDELGLSHSGQFFAFENTIEDCALDHLEEVINFLAKYSPLSSQLLQGQVEDDEDE